MKDMIEQIISTDKKSRESLEKTRQIKLQSAQKISDIRERKKKEYLEKARANIEIIGEEERIKAATKIKEIGRAYKRMEEDIDKVYNDNYEMWVEALVKRVIEG